MNRALNLVPKRAESRQIDQLRDTFVDSGVAAALEAVDHQVLYGRRGTGKTHALRYLETLATARLDVAVYADLRTLGSPEGLFQGDRVSDTERAARLLVDLLGLIHDSLLQAAIEDDSLISDGAFMTKLDAFLDSITTIRVSGPIEITEENQDNTTSSKDSKAGLTVGPSVPALIVGGGAANSQARTDSQRVTRKGSVEVGINFGDVARALRGLAQSMTSRRVWLLLDEWSSVPSAIQPFLGAFVVRCLLPLQMFTVKIGAIEQQSNFRTELPDGEIIGIELGADVAANVNLDEFMVFEQNEERARAFFRGLLFKHLTLGVDKGERVHGLDRENDLVKIGFTDKRAFDELVRAAEGVPRDAINIAAKAALRAQAGPISVPDVRAAAQAWFQTDKAAALNSRLETRSLLNWVIDRVIRQKRARGFLVNQRASGAPLLLALFDARVLHVVRRGYSAQDEPGERYDVYVIDYGAYVDLINTNNEPQGVLPVDGGFVDVPTQDLRALRRAVLDLDEFFAVNAAAPSD